MRKKATFPDKICIMCGKTYSPNGSMQKYCQSCAKIADTERKLKHYKKLHPNYKTRKEMQENSVYKKSCIACGEQATNYFDGKPYCNKHWLRMYNNGTTELKPYKTKNTYRIVDNVAIGTTSRGDIYKIDIDDLERCQQHSWVKDTRGYFVSNIKHKVTPLHRFILCIKDSKVVTDHINGDKSDNRKTNLRMCSQNQNGKNVKTKKNNHWGITGVKKTPSGSWVAYITVDGKTIHIGTFNSKLNAIDARRSAETKYYGEFSPFICRQK